MPPRKKKNDLLKDYSKEEMKFYDKLTIKEKEDIIQIEEELQNGDKNKPLVITPLRFKLLLANTSITNKRAIMNRFNELEVMCAYTGEYAKLYNLVNTISQIPFGIYYKIEYNSISEYLPTVLAELNKKIYGHNETKQQIMRILAQFMVNPTAKGYAIGIQGSMGVGKTKLIKDGVASVLKYPFAFISLGGISDSSYLKGNLYT